MPIANSAANVGSTFVIRATFDAGQGTFGITNPGRAFRVIQMYGTGANTSVITLRKNSGAGVTVAACTLVTGDLLSAPSVITQANADFLATDDLHFTVATANADGIEILCGPTSGGFALTTTNIS